MGLEPTTFELEVQRANPLRHGGLVFGSSAIITLILDNKTKFSERKVVPKVVTFKIPKFG